MHLEYLTTRMADHAEVATTTDSNRSGRHGLGIEKTAAQTIDSWVGPLRLHENHIRDSTMSHLPYIRGAMTAMDGDHVAPVPCPASWSTCD